MLKLKKIFGIKRKYLGKNDIIILGANLLKGGKRLKAKDYEKKSFINNYIWGITK